MAISNMAVITKCSKVNDFPITKITKLKNIPLALNLADILHHQKKQNLITIYAIYLT